MDGGLTLPQFGSSGQKEIIKVAGVYEASLCGADRIHKVAWVSDDHFCSECIMTGRGQMIASYGDGTVAEASFELALWVTPSDPTALTT